MSASGMIICPCGLRFDGTPKEALNMYRAHRCSLHEPQSANTAWPLAVWGVAVLVFLSFVLTKGWGLL